MGRWSSDAYQVYIHSNPTFYVYARCSVSLSGQHQIMGTSLREQLAMYYTCKFVHGNSINCVIGNCVMVWSLVCACVPLSRLYLVSQYIYVTYLCLTRVGYHLHSFTQTFLATPVISILIKSYSSLTLIQATSFGLQYEVVSATVP